MGRGLRLPLLQHSFTGFSGMQNGGIQQVGGGATCLPKQRPLGFSSAGAKLPSSSPCLRPPGWRS